MTKYVIVTEIIVKIQNNRNFTAVAFYATIFAAGKESYDMHNTNVP